MKIYPKDILLVSIQFLLFVLYTLDFKWFLGLSSIVKNIGCAFSILGLLIIIIALLQLNKNLSPFPTPKDNAVLLQNGLYKLVRHPIYSGIIFLFSGYGIYRDCAFKLLITLLLIVLFYFKSNYEEKQLQNKFPDYVLYKKKVGRFFIKF